MTNPQKAKRKPASSDERQCAFCARPLAKNPGVVFIESPPNLTPRVFICESCVLVCLNIVSQEYTLALRKKTEKKPK